MRTRLLNLMSVNSLLKDSKELSNQILFEPVPAGEQFLAPIIEALRDKTVIEMTYQGFGKPHPSTFVVEPYCLKMFKQRWYVLAYSPGIDQTYLYSLDRIHAIEPTTQKYKLPKGFNAETYFKDAYGTADLDYEPVEVKISISAKQAPYLRTLPLHKSQEEIETNEEYSIFRYFIIPSYDFKQELYKYGSDVEVLAPESMRKEFAEDAAKVNEMYNH
jgi:predicted DNA-binding transcriptional regulator YafY